MILNETFFLRKIQQSSATGLSNIFLDKYKESQITSSIKEIFKKANQKLC